MQQQRIYYLLEQYYLGSLSVLEQAELKEAIDTENETLLVDALTTLTQQNTAQAQIRSLPLLQLQPRVNAILAIDKQENIITVKAKPLWKRYSWQAAAVIALATVGIWLWMTNKKIIGNSPVAAHAVMPGENKATLTLSDGRIIILDNTAKGTLTEQNGFTIFNLEKGQLAYNSTGILPSSTALYYNVLTTPRGGQFQVILPDGSRVWLNSAGTLRYPTAFTGKNREVMLSGEAYFEIAENKSQPFKVITDKAMVNVLGTHFNVNAYPDEAATHTTLLEGKVSVYPTDSANPTPAVILTPGQQANIIGKVLTTEEVEASNIIAWKNGLFIFNHSDLPAILRQLSRWYNVEVIYEKETAAVNHYGGGISRSLPLPKVLELLEQEGNVKFRLEGRKLYVQ